MLPWPMGNPTWWRPPPSDMTRPRSAATARHGAAAFGRHRPTWRGRVWPPPPDMTRPRSPPPPDMARPRSAAIYRPTLRRGRVRPPTRPPLPDTEMNHYFLIFLFAIIINILLFNSLRAVILNTLERPYAELIL